jgi:CheY-like chemotaxis protein
MPLRILIADDHDDNRELLCFMLGDAEYDVHEARDGHECLRLARERQPDLIIIDISMPGLDGWQVFQELKADQRTSDIPCIAVTAYSEIDRQRALEAGIDAYLSKPFRSEELLDTVKQTLADHTVKASAAGSTYSEP